MEIKRGQTFALFSITPDLQKHNMSQKISFQRFLYRMRQKNNCLSIQVTDWYQTGSTCFFFVSKLIFFFQCKFFRAFPNFFTVIVQVARKRKKKKTPKKKRQKVFSDSKVNTARKLELQTWNLFCCSLKITFMATITTKKLFFFFVYSPIHPFWVSSRA